MVQSGPEAAMLIPVGVEAVSIPLLPLLDNERALRETINGENFQLWTHMQTGHPDAKGLHGLWARFRHHELSTGTIHYPFEGGQENDPERVEAWLWRLASGDQVALYTRKVYNGTMANGLIEYRPTPDAAVVAARTNDGKVQFPVSVNGFRGFIPQAVYERDVPLPDQLLRIRRAAVTVGRIIASNPEKTKKAARREESPSGNMRLTDEPATRQS